MPHSPACQPWRRIAAVLLFGACLLPASAAAQDWPSAPVTAFDGRVTLSGDLTVTAGSDDLGYFNYTDYDRSALRLGRLDLVTTARAGPHLSFVLELRAEGDLWQGHWTGSPYAAFVRVRPWLTRPIEIEAGRVPTAFGAFLGRAYGASNPLIGYPLAYQYLTSLRADSIPADADTLIASRGRGWFVGYAIGNQEYETGVPMVSAFRYDTGVRVRVGSSRSRVQTLVSVTSGTLSRPLTGNDNGAPQVAGRVLIRPIVGLEIGASAARGAFLSDVVRRELPAPLGARQYAQRAFGADVEYSRDHWLVRSETIWTTWSLPALARPALGDVSAGSWLIEGRYTILPQLYAAVRLDRLWFGEIQGTAGPATWDANVNRIEAGVGYRLTRTATAKASVQQVERDGGRTGRDTLGAVQVTLWF